MSTTIQIRRDTAANWTTNNPTPANGEFCISSDLSPVRLKIGDGVTDWASLPYFTLKEATTSEAGIMSVSDKVKLNGIEASALGAASVMALMGAAGGESVRVTYTIPSAGDYTLMSDESSLLMCVVGGKGYSTATDVPMEAGNIEVTFLFADPKTIPADAFKAVSEVAELHIPSFVHSIGDNAFGDCAQLLKIDCEGMTPPATGTDAFLNVDTGSAVLYVHKVAQTAYTNDAFWGTFSNIDTYDNL